MISARSGSTLLLLLWLLSVWLAECFQYNYSIPSFAPSSLRNYTVRFTRYYCTGQPYQYFQVVACGIRLHRNDPSELILVGRFLEPQPYVNIAVKCFYRFHTFQPIFIDEMFDYCESLKNPNSSSVSVIARMMIANIESIENFVPKCPLQGWINTTTGFLDASRFPPFLPAGEYRLDYHLRNQYNETLYAVSMHAMVRPKGPTNLSMG